MGLNIASSCVTILRAELFPNKILNVSVAYIVTETNHLTKTSLESHCLVLLRPHVYCKHNYISPKLDILILLTNCPLCFDPSFENFGVYQDNILS